MEITEIDSLMHKHNIVFTFLQNFVKSTNFLDYIVAVFTKYFGVEKMVYDAVWKNEKFTLTEKNSRQINYSLVRTLLSRNFVK